MKEKNVWLKDDVFIWEAHSQWIGFPNKKHLTRAYDLWSHAELSIEQGNSEFHLADAISTLKKCLNQRLKTIEKTYKLKQISPANASKGYLELLESFDLVRPLMLKKLMTVRNDIEHKDAKPPSKARCQELLDLTWYFLKSTDSILKMQSETLEYTRIDASGKETPYGYSLKIDYEHKRALEIFGWFSRELISKTETDGFKKIRVKNMHTKAEKWSECSHHKDKRDDDVWLVGKLEAKEPIKNTIFKTILNIH